MMDNMQMKGMRFYGYHGVYPEENKLGQHYIIDLEMRLDLERAGQSDDLEVTVNYAEVYKHIKAVVEGPPFKLIEALASSVASRVLEVYTMVHEVTVRVTKPNPPFEVFFDGVTIELNRSRRRSGNES